MSTYRHRDRTSRYGLNGYRSQPVSNRSSLYLSGSNDYSSSSTTTTTSSYLATDMSDFDRQFKRLLERTEKFTNRVEKLQSTSTSLTKGFRNIDRTVSGRQREHVSLYDSLIDQDPQSTEDEWKRYLDRRCLVEKAVEQLRRQYRYPKASFEYSPKSRSPYSYNISPNTKLVSNPRTPTDRHGRKVRDKGMEQLDKNVIKDDPVLLYDVNTESTLTPMSRRRAEKALEILAEEEEPIAPKPSTSNSIKNLRNEIATARVSSKDDVRDTSERNGKVPSVSSTTAIEKDIVSEEPKRKESWRSRRAARNEAASTTDSKVNKDEEQEESEKKHSKTHKIFDSIKKRSKSKGKESKNEKLERMNGEKDDSEESKVQVREHSSSKARPTTMYYDPDSKDDANSGNKQQSKATKDSNRNSLFLDDENTRKSKSSSSFHEYIPGHNVPLKERLRIKQMEQNKPTNTTSRGGGGDSEFNSVIVTDNSLAQRASKIIRAKYHSSHDNNTDDASSPTKTESKGNKGLTSKFFRRFRGGGDSEKEKQAKDENKASSIRRKRDEKKNDDNDDDNDDDEKYSTTKRLSSESPTLNESKNNSLRKKQEAKGENNDINSVTKRLSENNENTNLNTDADKTKPSSLQHTNDSLSKTTKTTTDTSNENNVGDSIREAFSNLDNELTPRRIRRRLGERSPKSPDQETISPKSPDEGTTVTTTTNDTTVDTNDQTKLTDSVVYRRRKNRDKKNEDTIGLTQLNRKSVYVYEEEIVPERTLSRVEKLRLDFRSPERSRDEVDEEILEQEKTRGSVVLPDDIFDRLQELEFLQEDELKIEMHTDVAIDSAFLDKLETLTTGEEESEESSADLTQFIVPIEHENNLRMQQIDQMFDQIDQVNENMYEELMNLTRHEDGSKSDDEVFNSAQRARQYEPTKGKVQKMKIHKQDLMGAQRFVATKQSWSTKASLSRTRSIDSVNDDQQPTSTSVRKRTNSDDSDRRSSLLDINDDAVKYVAKYTNKSIEELKGENPVERQFTKAPKVDLSEIEKTQDDMDKMLENCENIDKINNSISDSNKQENVKLDQASGGGGNEVNQIIETARQIAAAMEQQAHVDDTADESDATLVPSSPIRTHSDIQQLIAEAHERQNQQSESPVAPSSPTRTDSTLQQLNSDARDNESQIYQVAGPQDVPSEQLSVDDEKIKGNHDNVQTRKQQQVTKRPSTLELLSMKVNNIVDLGEATPTNAPIFTVGETEDSLEETTRDTGFDSQKQHLAQERIRLDSSTSPYSPTQSEYGTPPRTPSELKKMNLASDIKQQQQPISSATKDENNNVENTSVIKQCEDNTLIENNNTSQIEANVTKKTEDDKLNEISNASQTVVEEDANIRKTILTKCEDTVPVESNDTSNTDIFTKEENKEIKDKEAELAASPFSFSLLRSNSTKQQNRQANTSQLHKGLFGGSLSCIPTTDSTTTAGTSDPKTPDRDSNPFRITKVASKTRLSLEQPKKLEQFDSSFRLLRVASATKLNMLAPTKPLPKNPCEKSEVNETSTRESDLVPKMREDVDRKSESEQAKEDEIDSEKNETTNFIDLNRMSNEATTAVSVETCVLSESRDSQIITNELPDPNNKTDENTYTDSLNSNTEKLSKETTKEASPNVVLTTSLEDCSSMISNQKIHEPQQSTENFVTTNSDHLNSGLEQQPTDNQDHNGISNSSSSSTIKAMSRKLSNGSTMSPPFSGSDDESSIAKRSGRSVLEKQLSIKEYRMKKMQREGTIETSISDDDPPRGARSDGDVFGTVSPLADVSDTSVEMNLARNKRYSHSKKDIRNTGMESSSSESDVPVRKTAGQKINEKLNRLNQFNNQRDLLKNPILPYGTSQTNRFNNNNNTYSNSKSNSLYTRTWHSTGEEETGRTERRKRHTRRTHFRSVDEY